MKIVFPSEQEDFHRDHPIATMGKNGVGYYRNFVLPVKNILAKIDVAEIVRPPCALEHYIIEWRFGSRKVRTLVDYGDETLVSEAGDCDGIFKMKCHPERHGATARSEHYDFPGISVPVFPAGYILAPGAGMINATEWLEWHLPRLVKIKKRDRQIATYYARGGWKVCRHPIPARDNTKQLNRWPNRRVDWEEYHEEMARHRVFLNLCGQGDSIDRKVVEACAIGCNMVSTSGLRDLALPWGHRFVDGDNVIFADSIVEIRRRIDAIISQQVNCFGDHARELFDACFHPDSLAKWWFRCAISLL